MELPTTAITVERLSAPHVPPTKLPHGKIAVYVFSKGPYVLNVGKAGAKSQTRYTSQHHNPVVPQARLQHRYLPTMRGSGCVVWMRRTLDDG
jgi:hypothetical protein